MKILETQSAVLTNYEVYTHLIEQKNKHKLRGFKSKRPGNLETVVKELLEYLNDAASPLACKPFPYNENTIRNLLERLRPWDLTKAEIVMIINLRPIKPESLNAVIEEMEARFPQEETQFEICAAIQDVLGKPEKQIDEQK
ncbi:hypothetical protein OnM2_014027 [Erysiphe neolycopersici]|uniref:DNA-directed RNA polymerase III subunit RPC9 n=1 Tax=Erysiphe neolycopersici TaxID=212602 RepID=A0A420I5H2_9PEZI|nr:hypothetical protein OnM2_014027 [Erysiphe neolycopersici]